MRCWNVGWRYLLVHRWQSFLMVLGIALGVAVVVSIDLANASAARAFELSTETVTGKTTHQIEGGAQGVPEEIYTRLRREDIVDLAAPVISEYVTSPQLGSRPMQLLGIDPFADAPFRSFLGQAEDVAVPELQSLAAFLVKPGALLISQPLAERYGLAPGDRSGWWWGGMSSRPISPACWSPVTRSASAPWKACCWRISPPPRN